MLQAIAIVTAGLAVWLVASVIDLAFEARKDGIR